METQDRSNWFALSRLIGQSANTIIRSGIIANSQDALKARVVEIHGGVTKARMNHHKNEAIRVLTDANLRGMTVEKPYYIEDNVVYGFFGGQILPLHIFGQDAKASCHI